MGEDIKVSIEEINKEQEEEILIRCHEVDDEICDIVNKLKTESLILLGYHNERVHRIKLSDIYYFEAVDGKVFIYSKDKVFEVKQKLYELEELCKEKNCFRASKSTVLNIAKISVIHPSISGRFEAVLDNGERVVISRQYVPVLKNMLGL
ncbi:transcriptional regulator, LytTR family [Paenibacillus sophorae]|uniref:Transcriptional regulator, LytTR family n=1 Tax=Paenibacillus sophorae TaxID=1333845 RepID=A0A1H8THX9_9BACL|nr:LytTR family DNA-binding domain-containing protein [Paenibacillus sophorae]SEO90532.1 transcriptional regulator, LytTR family [Paenibacillus sophorae]